METKVKGGRLPESGGVIDVTLRSEAGVGKPVGECSTRDLGCFGEDVTASFLEQCGAEILERNWRCPFGEADIIALMDDVILMVEVKTRAKVPNDSGLVPEVAVDYRKRGRYERMALVYLANQTRLDAVRFDIAAINLIDECTMRLRYMAGAYGWDC